MKQIDHDPLVDVLAEAVGTHQVRRVPLAVLRRAFTAHDPSGAVNSDSRDRLAAAIRCLEERELVELPRSRGLYETHLKPELPLWIERPAAVRLAHVARPIRIWRPELASAAAIATSDSERDLLEKVDAFLRDQGSSRPEVPHRERSLQLFGNEKRLDHLLRTRLFTSGAITLQLLRCYIAPLPLTAQHTGNPGAEPGILIVENHATYASILRLARERSARHLSQSALAVGFGAGTQLVKAIAGIQQLSPVPEKIWYFGDLDEEGLAIAQATAKAAAQSGLPQFRPAVPLYRSLLAHGVVQVGNRAVPSVRAQELTFWLEDTEVAEAVGALLTTGKRMAQEAVGYEILRDMSQWTLLNDPE